jgi:hypothetical protein
LTFNYLVAIFYKRPIRQGSFGRPSFRTPLDRHFWWIGLLAIAAGLAVGLASLALGLHGWALERSFFWERLAAMSGLVGVQLAIGWFSMRALEELSRRESAVAEDLSGSRQRDPDPSPAACARL